MFKFKGFSNYFSIFMKGYGGLEIKHSNVIKPFKRLKFFGLILISIILLALVSGYLYEFISYKNIKINYPPDGQMIDVGNREIHMNIKGTKTSLPPILIETGTGNWSYDWSNVQKELSKHTQVITYDRAGYGWSDPPPNGFSIGTTIDDLSKILESTNIDTPVILVGHSVGGIYSRLFADKYPEKVSGLILVDSRNEYFSEQATTFNDKFFESQDQTINRILSQIGIVRLIGENMFSDSIPDYISPKKYVNVHWDTPFFKVLDEEIKKIKVSEKLLKDTQSLGNKPLTIVTPTDVELQATELGFSEQEANNLKRKWKESQKQLTNLSTNSELILVSNSSHSVMYDQPKVIIEAILEMADEIN
jgi:pimeloyl-ACP methyl ester carboxylesterase